MRIALNILGTRYVLKASFLPGRYIKWLPAVFWAKVGPATKPKEKTK